MTYRSARAVPRVLPIWSARSMVVRPVQCVDRTTPASRLPADLRPRGVGKTTIARILAKSLNCETGVGAEP